MAAMSRPAGNGHGAARPAPPRAKGWRTALLLTLLSAAAAAACSGPLKLSARPEAPRPTLQSARLEVLALGPRTADLRLHLTVDNPGEALEVQEAALEWMLDEYRFASSRHRLNASWPARQIAEQAIDISLAYFSLPFAEFSDARRRDDFQLIVQGELTAAAEDRQVAISISAQAPLSRPKDR